MPTWPHWKMRACARTSCLSRNLSESWFAKDLKEKSAPKFRVRARSLLHNSGRIQQRSGPTRLRQRRGNELHPVGARHCGGEGPSRPVTRSPHPRLKWPGTSRSFFRPLLPDRQHVGVFHLFERKTRLDRRNPLESGELLLHEPLIGGEIRDHHA